MWLQVKARKDGWNEEVIWVENEMQWVINWYNHKKEWWTSLAKESEEGHAAYAWKQVALWNDFLLKAKKTFSMYIET